MGPLPPQLCRPEAQTRGPPPTPSSATCFFPFPQTPPSLALAVLWPPTYLDRLGCRAEDRLEVEWWSIFEKCKSDHTDSLPEMLSIVLRVKTKMLRSFLQPTSVGTPGATLPPGLSFPQKAESLGTPGPLHRLFPLLGGLTSSPS